MTFDESRIKELAEYHGLNLYTTARDLAETEKCMRTIIRVVAAEAQQKGIEEFYTHLIKIHPASLEQIANLMNELLEKKNV